MPRLPARLRLSLSQSCLQLRRKLADVRFMQHTDVVTRNEDGFRFTRETAKAAIRRHDHAIPVFLAEEQGDAAGIDGWSRAINVDGLEIDLVNALAIHKRSGARRFKRKLLRRIRIAILPRNQPSQLVPEATE